MVLNILFMVIYLLESIVLRCAVQAMVSLCVDDECLVVLQLCVQGQKRLKDCPRMTWG